MAVAMATLSACRFCLAAKSEADGAPSQDPEQIEVYSEMLKNTFNVEIVYNPEQRLVCQSCITKLCAAQEFKQLVLNTEQRFAEILHQYERQRNLPRNWRSRTKDKPGARTQLRSEDEFKFEEEATAEECSGNDAPVVVKSESASPPRRRRSGRRTGDVTSAKKKKPEANTSAAEEWKKLTDRRGNAPILRENTLKLLANSTMCIFQWHKSRYRCFCCNEPFANMEILRRHTNSSHTIKNIEKKIILQQNRLVKVEISTLDCKLCGHPLQNLASLKQHLVNEHKVDFTLEEDLLVPFKLDADSLQCQICAETFSVFRHLNIHMNRHYQKQVCHICGAGFSNLVYLNLHKTRSHKPLRCNECQIDFCTKSNKRDHDSTVHNVTFERKLRFPCPFCSERYFQEHLRILHLVEKHGMVKPEHSCSICGKVYVTKSLRNNHLKNVHMKQKNRECEVCQVRFYTKSDLNRHKVTHTGEKNFSCASCSNLYATKDSLNRHVKRTHNI